MCTVITLAFEFEYKKEKPIKTELIHSKLFDCFLSCTMLHSLVLHLACCFFQWHSESQTFWPNKEKKKTKKCRHVLHTPSRISNKRIVDREKGLARLHILFDRTCTFRTKQKKNEQKKNYTYTWQKEKNNTLKIN